MVLRRLRVRMREVLASRWREVSVFFEYGIDGQRVLMCTACFKRTPDPAATALTIIIDGPAIWAMCQTCGQKERIGSKG